MISVLPILEVSKGGFILVLYIDQEQSEWTQMWPVTQVSLHGAQTTALDTNTMMDNIL